MVIEFKRIDDAFHLEAVNETGQKAYTDALEDLGGSGQAMRPMQLMMVSLGGCSAIDVIHILRRQRQPLVDFKLRIDAARERNKTPALFTDINLHFTLTGDLNPEKVQLAIDLSLKKYCSAAKIIEKTSRISSSYEIIPG